MKNEIKSRHTKYKAKFPGVRSDDNKIASSNWYKHYIFLEPFSNVCTCLGMNRLQVMDRHQPLIFTVNSAAPCHCGTRALCQSSGLGALGERVWAVTRSLTCYTIFTCVIFIVCVLPKDQKLHFCVSCTPDIPSSSVETGVQ